MEEKIRDLEGQLEQARFRVGLDQPKLISSLSSLFTRMRLRIRSSKGLRRPFALTIQNGTSPSCKSSLLQPLVPCLELRLSMRRLSYSTQLLLLVVVALILLPERGRHQAPTHLGSRRVRVGMGLHSAMRVKIVAVLALPLSKPIEIFFGLFYIGV